MVWDDLSFDVRSFSERSWGLSWGLTYEAAQELFFQGGGGPDASDSARGGRTETPEDYEHLERQAEFKRRLYSKPTPAEQPAIETPPSGATPELAPPPAPSSEAAVPFYSTDLIASDLSAAKSAIDAIVDDVRKKRDEEEALLLILLDSAS